MKVYLLMTLFCCLASLSHAQIMTEVSVMEVNTDNFSQVVEQSGQPVIIDFYASWCQPCKKMSPIFEELSKEFKNVKFVKVNVDHGRDIAKRYNVSSLPTFVLIKNGQEVSKQVGMISKEGLANKLKSLGS